MDVIADMLSRMRNALMAGHTSCQVFPASKTKVAILQVLKRQGYIEDFEVQDRNITVKFSFDKEGKPVISGLKRVSKPSRRVYVSAKEVPWVLNGLGIAVISTSKGMMSDAEARSKKLGGEIVCEVW